ncbi:MAG: replicative DNA helicase [Gammaproteobacteria bacterium]
MEASATSSEGLQVAQEAEQALLAALILGTEDWLEVVEQVAPEDFSSPTYQLIYRVIKDMLMLGEEIDAVSVSNKLDQLGHAQKVGGRETIQKIILDYAESFHTLAYARIIRERGILRKVSRCAGKVLKKSSQPAGETADDLLSWAQNEFFQLGQDSHGSLSQNIWLKEAVIAAKEQQARLQSGENQGLKTGFVDVDKVIRGFAKGDLIILAARPSAGKTAFALEMVRSAAKQQTPAIMFSLEMPALSIAQRLLVMEGRIDGQRLLSGRLSKQDLTKFDRAAEMLSAYPLLLDDSSNLSVDLLTSRARRAKFNNPDIGLVIVDYLQLVRGGNQENRVQEVSYVSRNLKALARTLEVPVIALSQMSRSVEQQGKGGGNRKPRLSDLRDSGAIEQDADLIMFLHSEGQGESGQDDPWLQSMVELRVAKHRNGPIGNVDLRFFRELMSFRNAGST